MASLVTVFNLNHLHSCLSRLNGMSVCRYYANSLECTLQREQVNLTAAIVDNFTGGNLASYDTLRRRSWIEIGCVSVNGFAQVVSRIWRRDCGTSVKICDEFRYDYTLIECVPLAKEPGISLIILTPMKILQRNFIWGRFVVWEMKRNVSVVRLIVATWSSGPPASRVL
jgi:hypothetical protein